MTINLELILIVVAALLLGPVILVAALNLTVWRCERGSVSAAAASVTVLIPARNEEWNLASCVEAAIAKGPGLAEVLVYNDESTDKTQEVIDSLKARYPGLVRQAPRDELPAGWAGKPHACKQLADAARSKWLLFVDADTRLMPGAIDSLISIAERRNASFLSAWPRIEMRSFSERFLMPLLNFVVFSIFPTPISRVRQRASLGLAHGACILALRETYQRIGGHSLVRDRLFEDTELARAWRRRGENSQVTDGSDIATLRMYSTFQGIWNGFSKNYYPAFSSQFSFALFQAHLAISYVIFPIVVSSLVAIGALTPVWLGLIGASLIPRLLIAFRFRHSLWSVPLHPLAVALMVALGLWSWWLSTFGGGVVWKDRRYRASGAVVGHE